MFIERGLTVRGEKHFSVRVWAEGGAGVGQKVTSRFGRLARQDLSHGARWRRRRAAHVYRVLVALSLAGERTT